MEISTGCYCGRDVVDDNYFECVRCKGAFHEDCLHSHGFSALGGDYLFLFTCAKCSSSGEEIFDRPKLSWVQVVALALFNLQLQSSGRQGFFRWREHICCFIGQHWETFFGTSRKKPSSWHSTISGTLSSNSPAVFQSGTSVFGEPGWWRLSVVRPPKLSLGSVKKRPAVKGSAGLTNPSLIPDSTEDDDGSHQSAKKVKLSASASFSSMISLASPLSNHLSPDDTCSGIDELSIHIDMNDDALAVLPPLDLAQVVKTELLIDADNDSYQKDETESHFAPVHWASMTHCPASQSCSSDTASLEDTCDSDSRSTVASSSVIPVSDMRTAAATVPPTTLVQNNNTTPSQRLCVNTMPLVKPTVQAATAQAVKDEPVSHEPSLMPAKPSTTISSSGNKLSLYHEAQLLKDLHDLMAEVPHVSARVARFYRKLVIRKAKRDARLPLLELTDYIVPQQACTGVESFTCQKQGFTILDRYQAHYSQWRFTPLPFSVRLVGCSEDQHEIIRSPYTARMLKPYIWRNYDCLPTRLKLLNEIIAYPHRSDPSWCPPPRMPIDFCYVRPEHIPTVNAMCHHFFWPGIDLSECLHYPDFSCVVLYRKLIIAFAFMVPDASFNEAYVSFIFTHPEWRGAGIASFMLYHLIQTCMGKDVSLHVSATNPAIMLYHKFGFKAQELILNFYDKYLPPDSVDCRHALALKLEK